MHIVSSQLQQAVSYQYERQQAQLSVAASPARSSTVSNRQPSPSAIQQPNENANPRAFQASSHGLAQAEKATSSPIDSQLEQAIGYSEDVQLRVLVLLLERLTGRTVELMDPEQLTSLDAQSSEERPAPPQPVAEPAAEQLDLNMVYISESESLNYQSSGSVTTADGRQLSFSYQMQMSRSFEAFSLVTKQGEANDPLLLVLPGSNASLQPNADNAAGEQVALPTPASGSGYLVIDTNGDGKYSGKEELIGGSSGNAFAELAAMDEDGNSFIDEGDTQFFDIYYYQPGNSLQSLQQVGVGALSLAAAATPYHYKQGDETYAEMVASSVALMEGGGVAGLHQIDLFQ